MSNPIFGFQGRLNKDFPSQIIVDVTEICNLACVHCPHPEFKKSHHFSSQNLDIELNKKLVDEVREHGKGITQYIRYTGNGEPLVHPKIYDFLMYAVQNSGTFVTLTTNAKLMNEKRVEALIESGLHLIDISIDAVNPDTYAAIRVGGNLEVTRRNVLKLIEIRNRSNAKTKIVVSFVEQPNNTNEAAEFKKFWEENGADFVIIRRLHSAAGGVASIAKELTEKASQTERYPCLYPWERVLLNPKGQLAYCPQDWSHGSVVANYRETTIKETWSGTFYNELRKAHLQNTLPCNSFCGKCPDWQQTRWPGQGRSYADLVTEFKAEAEGFSQV